MKVRIGEISIDFKGGASFTYDAASDTIFISTKSAPVLEPLKLLVSSSESSNPRKKPGNKPHKTKPQMEHIILKTIKDCSPEPAPIRRVTVAALGDYAREEDRRYLTLLLEEMEGEGKLKILPPENDKGHRRLSLP